MRFSGRSGGDGAKKRLRIVIVAFFLAVSLVIYRLFSWQIIRAEELQKVGQNQQKTSQSVGAKRGAILSSDGYPLASSTVGWVLWATLEDIKDPEGIAKKLAPLLVVEPIKKDNFKNNQASESGEASISAEPVLTLEELTKNEEIRLQALLSKKGKWVALKYKLANAKKEEIEKLAIPGIGFDPEEKRIYPEGEMAAHILGFVGKDSAGQDKGYFGLEGKYDVALSGVGGEKIWERDAVGNPIVAGTSRRVAALDGVSLSTHLERPVQFAAEKHLKIAMEKYGAVAGSVIILRPTDGAVIGMTALPNYRPEIFGQYKQEEFINPAISQSFEPGSVFKVLVMAAALDAGAVKLDDKCDTCQSARTIGAYTIRTWDEKYHANTTPEEIIKNSDNIGMVWAAEKLGKEKLYEYLTNFGIGSLSGIDLQGEATPSVKNPNKWGLIDLATTSFGQGIAVTPIQMTRAVAAIANGGLVTTPQVVDKVTGSGWEEKVKPHFGTQVISKTAAEEITNMMITAVKSGEAKWATPKGYTIAGKTGTAQIPIAGHYDPDKTIASFVGFAPAKDPKFVMMVTLREPTSSPWASETAAPLWFNIAKDLFLHFGISPEN